jgi:hypothetical protein
MASTTFTGPIRAGNILNTTGTTVGNDVANVGYVVLAQKAEILQTMTAGVALPIVIPANSTIIGISSYAVTDFTGNFDLGITAGGAELVEGAPCAAGVSICSADTDPRAILWANVGPNDVRVYCKSATTGIGVGYIVVQYAQAINASVN